MSNNLRTGRSFFVLFWFGGFRLNLKLAHTVSGGSSEIFPIFSCFVIGCSIIGGSFGGELGDTAFFFFWFNVCYLMAEVWKYLCLSYFTSLPPVWRSRCEISAVSGSCHFPPSWILTLWIHTQLNDEFSKLPWSCFFLSEQ